MFIDMICLLGEIYGVYQWVVSYSVVFLFMYSATPR